MDPIEHWPSIPPPVAPSAPYPVELVVVRSERPDRLSTAVRLILVLPHLGFAIVVELAAVVALGIAWVCGSVTGRVPDGLHAFLLWTLRYRAAVDCYAALLTDGFPPFSGADDPAAPIRVVAGPVERQPRWSVFLRGILALPPLFVSLCLTVVILFASIAAWSAVVVGGRLPSTISEVLEMGSSFILRTRGYVELMTDRYPWFEHAAPDEHTL